MPSFACGPGPAANSGLPRSPSNLPIESRTGSVSDVSVALLKYHLFMQVLPQRRDSAVIFQRSPARDQDLRASLFPNLHGYFKQEFSTCPAC